MVSKLKRRIILQSSSLSISVMLLVIVIAFFMAKEQEERYYQGVLESHVSDIVKTISVYGRVDDSQLEKAAGDGIYVYLEDRGRPLLLSDNFNGDIIDSVKLSGSNMGVNYENPNSSTALSASFLYSLQSSSDARVMIQQIPGASPTQWIMLIAFQNRSTEIQAISDLRVAYSLLGIAAAMALIIISWVLAGIAIQPTKESLRMQKEFISAASHELRTPLAVIKSSLSAIAVKPQEQERFTGVIHQEVEHLARLTKDLTMLGDSGAATWIIQKDSVNLDTLLLRLYESYLPLVTQQSHKLVLDLPEEPLPVVQADEKRIVQLLSILLNNAISHTKQGTTITVSGRHDGKKLILSVSDNGEGISSEHEKKIFQRFYRIDQSRGDKMHFGLGLSIAKEIAEKHGGKLVYTPTNGGGSTFEFTMK